MRVSTPIADMQITVGQIVVDGRVLVMSNGSNDSMPMRTVMAPSDLRQIFGAMLKPSVLWFSLTCLFRSDVAEAIGKDNTVEDHPTPNPW